MRETRRNTDLFKVYSQRFPRLLTTTARHIHGHNTGAMKNDAAPAGDNALNGLTGLGMFFQGLILHFLHYFKALGFLTLFLWDGLVNISWHDNILAWAENPRVEAQPMQGLEKGLPGDSNWA